MDNGIYIALSRQVAIFRDLDVTANNIANVNTGGFNGEDVLHTPFSVNTGPATGKIALENPVGTFRRTDPGTLTSTGNALDVAINGHGYFAVETPLGTRYTRAGNFQLDANGVLVTAAGYPVLDNSGQRITFDPEDQDIKIGSIGNISVDGEERATLNVATFANEQAMEPLGNGLYRADATPLPNPEDGSVLVTQGTLEGSNVEPVKQLVHMIDLQRSVDSTTKMINGLYDLQQRTSRILSQQSGG